MIKSFLNLLCISTLLFSSEQIVLVVSDDLKSPQAKLACYENGKKVFHTITVNLGKNGLGWGIGEVPLAHNSSDAMKQEGDKKAPSGVFKLESVFGYARHLDLKMPYTHTSKNLICVDDSASKDYNKIIVAKGNEKSFEFMQREDNLYKYGIVVGHNEAGIKNRGSCIFLHIQRAKATPTVGCTSMQEADIKKILYWLDKAKHPLLIQIPKSAAQEVKEKFPQLRNSKLLL